MCDKAVDAFLRALKFLPNWFATNKRNTMSSIRCSYVIIIMII